MKSKIYSIIIFLTMVINIIPFNHSFYKKVIIVDNEVDGDFTSIQEAVNHAKDRDIILVYSGEYNEEVKIHKDNITIEGIPYELGKGNDKGKPLIKTISTEYGYGIFIEGNNCTIKNMKIIGSGCGWRDRNMAW